MNLDEAIVIALGGNVASGAASVQAVLEAAIGRMAEAGITPLARSRWWRSAAWPDPSEPPFLNGVVIVRTDLEPAALMGELMTIESAFGRERSRPNAPRTLDLDLIAYGRRVIQAPDLGLPHPRAAERRFVMGPLAEIAPDWVHPVLGRTALELAGQARVGADATPVG